jgi:hypothetical protein
MLHLLGKLTNAGAHDFPGKNDIQKRQKDARRDARGIKDLLERGRSGNPKNTRKKMEKKPTSMPRATL